MPRYTQSAGGVAAAWHAHPAVEPRPAASHAAQPASRTWTLPHPNSPVAWNFKVVYFFPSAFGFQEYLMGRVRANSPACSLPLEIKQVLGPSLAKLVSCGS